MKLSKKWLNDFVKIDIPSKDYANAMTMSGSKVEGFEIEGSDIKNVVVGKILSVSKHPNADKLSVCMIDVAREKPLQVVTGATNIKEGDLVPVALDGAFLPDGKTIKTGELRGVLSEGMLCSISELNLTKHDFPDAVEDGIFILDKSCKVGQDITEAIGLNDTVFEFEITSNRPDCLSVIGLARETAATYNLPFTVPTPKVKGSNGDISDYLRVTIQDKDLCSRYIAMMVKNVRIAPSPKWMRERLRASGVRPINNIVDITNYVMLEYGQPMHAFDYRFIEGGHIIVRRAVKGEAITTLDGVEHPLKESMLTIADEKKPIALAGVMGGEYSGIMDDTQTIVFESANFNPASVRTTAKELGMRTDSSSRFEKGLSPQMCLPAILRACELVEMLGAGEVVGGIIDCDYSVTKPVIIDFDPKWINEFLGTEIPEHDMRDYLTRLGFELDGNKIMVPHFRSDIETKFDIAEEIARLYGYDNIPTTALRGTAQAHKTREQKFKDLVISTLLAQGLDEIKTYSFISPKLYDKIRMPKDSPQRRSVTISNPLGEDTSIMRTTALPSMLQVLSTNYNNRNESAWLFEIATEYIPKGENELPEEKQSIIIGLYGDNADFFTIKGIVEELLDKVNISGYEFTSSSDYYAFHPGRCAEIIAKCKTIGVVGEIHPIVAENNDILEKVYAACLDINLMLESVGEAKQYTPLPKFPAVMRDLALVCDEDMPVGLVQKMIKESAGEYLESIELFDIYKGKQIAENKKSVAFNLTLRSNKSTLTDEESDKIVGKIISELAKINVHLRT